VWIRVLDIDHGAKPDNSFITICSIGRSVGGDGVSGEASPNTATWAE
jgi:hypothetical protein